MRVRGPGAPGLPAAPSLPATQPDVPYETRAIPSSFERATAQCAMARPRRASPGPPSFFSRSVTSASGTAPGFARPAVAPPWAVPSASLPKARVSSARIRSGSPAAGAGPEQVRVAGVALSPKAAVRTVASGSCFA